MHRPFRFVPPAVPAAVLLALALALAPLPGAGALAQSANDFRLQPGAAPRAAGPVDPDVPAPTAKPSPTSGAGAGPASLPPPSTAPAPSTPSPAPVPTLAVPPPPAVAPAVQIGRAGPGRAAGGMAAPAARGGPAPAASPDSSARLPAPAVSAAPQTLPAPAPAPAPEPAPVPAPVAVASRAPGAIAWWWLIPAALAGALGAWAALRRRGAAAAAPRFVPPRPMPEAAPEPERDAVAEPELAHRSSAAAADPLALDFAALRLSVSLVNATLRYRLTLANRSPEPWGPLAVGADMIAAHASLPEDAQLGRDGGGLELRHSLPGLGLGEAVVLSGELRLPLASVTPIRAGTASLLVPLVRLRIEGAGMERTMALVVGEAPASPDAPLRPFRLDHGPRIFGAVSQRALAAAA